MSSLLSRLDALLAKHSPTKDNWWNFYKYRTEVVDITSSNPQLHGKLPEATYVYYHETYADLTAFIERMKSAKGYPFDRKVVIHRKDVDCDNPEVYQEIKISR